MPATMNTEIAERLASECASLPPEKQRTVLDFILFLKQRSEETEGDEAWERLIADPRPRPKLEAYLQTIAGQKAELMDLSRL